MNLDDEAEALRVRVQTLGRIHAPLDDWRALDGRVFSAILATQIELVALQRSMIERVKAGAQDWSWLRSNTRVNGLVSLLDELHLLRLEVQGRILELEVTAADQRFAVSE